MRNHPPLLTTLIAAVLTTPLVGAAGCSPDRAAPAARATAKPAARIEVVEEFWPNGTLRLRRQVLRQPDGSLINHGTYTQWHINGNKEYEATYVRGELQGVARAWHKNGQKWTEEHYVHGVRHGVRRNWDENGRLRGEEHYFEGKPDGTWTIWKPDGSIEWQGHFERGQPK